ncbi:MAG: ArgE/DapE family deacylase [Chloroflexi bacterium]|nr:ArgE/DapE family deacylase [Chloroflexota bacterium]
MSEARVLEAVDDRRKELIEFAQKLVSIPSENPPGGEKEVVAAITPVIDRYSLGETRVVGRDTSRPNILTTMKGNGEGKRLLYNGHTDVVPVGQEERSHWKTDPFGAEIIDGELYGRGSADMKGPIASMLYGAIALKEAGASFAGDLVLAFTADEENGGYYGAQYVSEQGLAGADVCLIGEPSGMKSGFDYLATACRGATCFKLVVRGTQMHSSQSDIRNAVNAGLKLCKVLYRMSEELEIRHEPHPLYPQGVTINLGETLSGGLEYCIIPGYAEAKNDIRVLPGMSKEPVMKDLNDFLDKLRREDPQLDVELVLDDGQGWVEGAEIPADHPMVTTLAGATSTVMGFSPTTGGFTGGTDAHYFVFDANTPTISAFGPGLLNLAHGPNERVPVEDLVRGAKIYALAALRYLQ